MSELYDSVDYNNLKSEYVGPIKDVSFYGYKDSKELFNATKNSQIRLDVAIKRLSNKIRQVVYSLYQSKQITEKVYNTIIKSIQ